MPDSLTELIIDNISYPVAYFNEEGFLLKTNTAWELLCQKINTDCSILFYDDFVSQLRLPPIQDENLIVSNDVVFNNKHLRILRRRVSNGKKHGIIIEVEDTTSTHNSQVMSERIISDTLYKNRSRIASIQNIFALYTEYDTETLDPVTRKLFTRCSREMWELGRQMENMRYLMLIDTGQLTLPVTMESLNIRELVFNAVMKTEPLRNELENRVELSVYVDDKLHINSDRQILQHILTALLTNALMYNDLSGPVIINTLQEENRLRLSISDTGWGIAKDDLPSIFSYNFRGQRARRSIYSGLGIELYIVQRLVNLINASVEFISREDKGSVFSLLFTA